MGTTGVRAGGAVGMAEHQATTSADPSSSTDAPDPCIVKHLRTPPRKDVFLKAWRIFQPICFGFTDLLMLM